MLQPTNVNILIVLVVAFVLRYIILEWFPMYIVNGYFSLFFATWLIVYLFTSNMVFSILIGMFYVNVRILYRYSKDKQTLSHYNSVSNCLMFGIALVGLYFFIMYYKQFQSFSSYYGSALLILVLINLMCLQVNKVDLTLMCYV